MMLRLLTPFARAASAASCPFCFFRTTSRIHRKASCSSRSAKRSSPTSAAALPPGLEKWGALAVDAVGDHKSGNSTNDSGNEPNDLTSDPDFRANLDDLCTRALRAMLRGDVEALKPGSAWADDVSALGNYCVSRTPGNPHLDGARFAFFLLEIAANRWPKEADDLAGIYKEAAEKIHGVLENSGWRLALPGEKEDGGAGVAGGYDDGE